MTMAMIWLIGLLSVVAYRVYRAGSVDFTYGAARHGHKAQETDEDKVITYILITGMVAFFWLIVLPCIAIYRLGQKRK